MASSKPVEENTEKLKETIWQIHNRILCWREIWKEEGLVDKRRINLRITA
jgi:hypothetical protein